MKVWPGRVRDRGAAFALFTLVFGFYVMTLAPSLNWADAARVQLDVVLGGSTYWHFEEAILVPTDDLPFNRLGIAPSDHPLFVLLGQIALHVPWGEPLYRLNMTSALMGALALTIFFRLGYEVAGDWWAAALGAGALAVSHSFWFHSVTTEVYTLHAVFMLALIWLALRRPERGRLRGLGAFALLAGLGLANHLMLGLLLPVAVAYMAVAGTRGTGKAWYRPARYGRLLRRVGGRRLLIVAALFVIGFAPWWIQLARLVRNIGLPRFWQLIGIFVETFGGQLGSEPPAAGPSGTLLAKGGEYLAWLLYQFPVAGFFLGVYGGWRMWRRREGGEQQAGRAQALLLLALFFVHAGFSMNFGVADRFTFHLPSYVIFALFITYGAAEVRRRLTSSSGRGRWAATALKLWLPLLLVVAPAALYQVTPGLLSRLGVSGPDLGFPPVGNERLDRLSYFLNPNQRGDDSAERFALSTLRQVAPDAIVFTPRTSDQETYIVLRYYQLAEGRRPDVHLELFFLETVDAAVPQALLEMAQSQKGCRPLYLASLNRQSVPVSELEREVEIAPEANVYRLIPREGAPAGARCPDLSERWRDLTLRQLLLGLRRE